MAIVVEDLLEDMLDYLPSYNILSQRQMSKLAKVVITTVGDGEENYGEILCKSLLAAAKANRAKSHGEQDLRREEAGTTEYEYFASEDTFEERWTKYIQSLPNDICPLFGYEDLNSTEGLALPRICSGPKPDPLKLCNHCYPYHCGCGC